MNWSSMDDTQFKAALLQIVSALTNLHRAGIVHRNFHPDCVMIVKRRKALNVESDSDDDDDEEAQQSSAMLGSSLEGTMSESLSTKLASSSMATSQSMPNLSAPGSPSTSLLQKSTLSQPSVASVGTHTTTKSTKSVERLADKPLYQVTDFWFMHNPRKAGCSFSEGRADWGSRLTAPPEASGYLITDKSDIWAFGVCVYYWATRGLHLTIQDGAPIDFDAIGKLIPLKWGLWLRSLLKMCLQRNPKYRASAKDIYQFLVIAK